MLARRRTSTASPRSANVSDSRIRHGQYASRVVKDAVVDHFREKTGSRPSVDPKHPDLWLHLHLHRNKATLHLDTSGGSLHRRGYRERSIEAPMMETLAAGLVELSGWTEIARWPIPCVAREPYSVRP